MIWLVPARTGEGTSGLRAELSGGGGGAERRR